MSTETLLLIIMIMLLVGIWPVWPHSKSWGYAPTGALTFLVVIFVIWALVGDRPLFRRSGNVENAVQNAGHDIKAAGRDVADSVRDAVN
jgi:hypothetical protein